MLNTRKPNGEPLIEAFASIDCSFVLVPYGKKECAKYTKHYLYNIDRLTSPEDDRRTLFALKCI